MIKTFTVKGKLIAFLALFTLLLYAQGSFLPRALFFSFCGAAAAESLFFFLKKQKFSFPSSSAISALIVGLVIAGDEPWWVIFLSSLAAISSKYLIRFRKKHIFNPAAFGIFFVFILFKANTQWSGTFLWQILVPAGIYFAYQVRKIGLLAGYFAVSFLLFGLQSLVNNSAPSGIFGYFSYFYIFIMLIEPKTTPVKNFAKVFFGAAAACWIFIFVQARAGFDAELAALLLMNLAVPFLNMIPERRKK